MILLTMKRSLLLLSLMLSGVVYAQKGVTLSGYIKDSANGEELIGATVYVKELATGVVTNPYGFYSITLAPGPYTIQYRYIGFNTQEVTIDLQANHTKSVELVDEISELEEIVITATEDDVNISDLQMSKTKLDIEQLKKLPSALGEADILKNVQMQPGVISAGEGTSSFFVRGGSSDQNLILIDEAPVYDPSHLFGLFSVFNSDVIKESELYRGGIPARFGGRLSSILEVRTRDGNNKKFAGSGGIGVLASRIALEGPIVKNKSSYIVSARRSYVDIFQKKNKVFFYDINAKVNWKINDKNRIFTAFYNGHDNLSFSKKNKFGWGNTTGTLRWNHLFNERLFSVTTLITSKFDYKLSIFDPAQGFDWTSQIEQYSFNNDLNYYLNLNNELSFGYQFSYRQFQPGIISSNTNTSLSDKVELQKSFALDHALYLDNQQKIGNKITMSYGVRLSIFQNVGKSDVVIYGDRTNVSEIVRLDTLHFGKLKPIKTYVHWEPRFSFRYLLDHSSSIKASYNRMVQNTHLIASGTVPLPFNTWVPSGYYLKPQISDQIVVGYFKNLKEDMYEIAVEAYYKELQNVTDFADNADVFFNEDLPVEFRQGESEAYGVELSARKTKGKLTGYMSYTLSKVTRTISGVNQGKTFDANYDRRHVMNAVATYDYSPKWAFGANFTYSTGRPITLPSGRYELDGYNVDLISNKNGYRMAAFHNLSFSATLTPSKKKERRWKGQWVFSIYNTYNRKNAFILTTRVTQDKNNNIIGDGTQKEARQTSLFPILPTVTYNFKF